jgi:hypothetical protein
VTIEGFHRFIFYSPGCYQEFCKDILYISYLKMNFKNFFFVFDDLRIELGH